MSTTPEAERSDGKNRDALIRKLHSVVARRYVLIEKEDVIVYEQDGSIFQVMPEIVIVPENVVGYGVTRKCVPLDWRFIPAVASAMLPTSEHPHSNRPAQALQMRRRATCRVERARSEP